ncbi:unnamed protein product [Pleuronectes platessa]|uniref:non-specific protein-tyrosine kinase n=1 Tax=Pleuronectes platessa TaxID=8262 RepID=A0A9N7UHA8_PLEPL|nr:unnamed protein product [Pleuronectes platessa]
MLQCWAQKPDDRPTFVSLREFLLESMPSDMSSLQDFEEPDKLQIQLNDVITIIEGRAENYWWRGQNKRTLQVGPFPRNVVTSVAGLSAHDISRPLTNSFIHTGHGDSNPGRCWGFPDRIDDLYLGNPLDPPDVLSLDLSGTRPTQLPGRSKKPCYDLVNEDEDLTSAGLKRFSLRTTGSVNSLKIKPAAWVSASKQGISRRPGSGPKPNGEVSLIDFGEEFPPSTPSPSPVVEVQFPSLAELALEAENILDRTPPQSPSRSLPRPLHPTPIVDWDARPLPPPPAYDDVAQDEDDMEVSSINSSEQQLEEEQSDVLNPDVAPSCGQKGQADAPVSKGPDRSGLEDNLFLPSKQSQELSTSFSQSAEIFQELQQECMRRLKVPKGSAVRSSSPSQTSALFPHTSLTQEQSVFPSGEDKPQIPPRVPIPPRPIKRGDYTSARWSRDLSLSPTLADATEDVSGPVQNRPPQIPPRDPLSLSGSRTPSPMGLLVGSPQQRIYSVSPTTMQVPLTSAPPHMPMAPTSPPLQRGRRTSTDTIASSGRQRAFLLVAVEERHVRQANTATVRPMVVSNHTVQGHAQGQGLVQLGELKANFSSNNNSSLGRPRSGMRTSLSLPRVCSEGLTAPAITASCPRTDGGANPADRVKMVQEAVHGVTIEECQAALQNHNWNVQKAVHYLKVEQLFGLGLGSRSECLKLLETWDWNLEVASTQMLDNYGSTRQRR